jgi:electron transfer flavoprotein beta subunit
MAATVGPVQADAMLRSALAAGADSATRVDGPSQGAPSRWVAAELRPLAAGVDLVLCGHASLDRGSGAVPAFMAHELGWPQALGLVAMALEGGDGRLVLDRRLDGGRRERLALTGPGVLSVEPGPELRRAPLTSTLAASTAVIEVRAPSVAPPPDPGVVSHRPYRPRTRVLPPPRGSTRRRLDHLLGASEAGHSAPSSSVELTPAEAARLTVERLVRWGYLEP